jgi:ABC-type Fe3+-siderophore transport system permease subunit
MKLDLRLPIGLMFTIVGALLTVFGLMSDDAIYARSLGINVNLWWGLVLLAFGVVMLGFAMRAGGKQPASGGSGDRRTSS